jgi:transcriptional regulator with XRE-family HTH domain
MPLINTLRYLRKKKKWSRDFVAVESNICVRIIRYYEVGAISISLKNAERLSELFEVDASLIVGKNQKVFISDEEYEELIPPLTHREMLMTKMQQFISGTLPKCSLKEIYMEVIVNGHKGD